MAKKYIAITGGIGSGKSLALQFLRELNYPAFSCDELYKEVISSEKYIKEIEKLFPTAVVNGQVNRAALCEIVFNNEENRMQLNNLAHPLIMDLLFKNMQASKGELAFAEVPLLFEGNFENLFDKVIYISRDKEQRTVAVTQRDKCRRDEVEKRICSQFDAVSVEGEKRLKNCNATIIYNNTTKEDLKKEILNFIKKM